LNRDDNTGISGEWNLQNDQSGKLVGSMDDKKITINLNPDMIDNNTFLFGDFNNDSIEGNWYHSGVMGVNNKGTFIAKSF
jgi:hypothetical protein